MPRIAEILVTLQIDGAADADRFKTLVSKSGDLDALVREALAQLGKDEARRARSDGRRLELYCSLFMDEGNEGVTLSPETMRLLAENGVELGLHLYAPRD